MENCVFARVEMYQERRESKGERMSGRVERKKEDHGDSKGRRSSG